MAQKRKATDSAASVEVDRRRLLQAGLVGTGALVAASLMHSSAAAAATRQAMKEVSGPVIAIALILSSVFLPVAFMSGIQGRLNNQFAVTIAIAVLISAFNALTLSPALSAQKPRDACMTDGAIVRTRLASEA